MAVSLSPSKIVANHVKICAISSIVQPQPEPPAPSPVPDPRFATWDPNRTSQYLNLSNNNLTISGGDGRGSRTALSSVTYSMFDSYNLQRGFYAEFMVNSDRTSIGIASSMNFDIGNVDNAVFLRGTNQTFRGISGFATATEPRVIPTKQNPVCISVAWGGSYVNFAINGVWYFGGFTTEDGTSLSTYGAFDTGKKAYLFGSIYNEFLDPDPDLYITANFGGLPWKYAPPTGYAGWEV